MLSRDSPIFSTAGISPADLDAILAIQLTVAWAGETIDGEKRFGWWRSELTDPEAGGDFLTRLLPRTHAWAALIAVREAARRVDEAARRRAGSADSLWSLYHLGFAHDERLDARLAEHRQRGTLPRDVFGAALGIAERFDQAAFASWLEGLAGEPVSEVVPGGRKLSGAPKGPLDATRKLARALLPLGSTYPLPVFGVAKP